MAPWKCPDCGTWWGVLPEHRCPPGLSENGTVTIAPPFVVPTTMTCTCPPNRGDNYLGHCPIHDAQVTYTMGAA